MKNKDKCHLSCFINDLKLIEDLYRNIEVQDTSIAMLFNTFVGNIIQERDKAENLAKLLGWDSEEMKNHCH